jgi:hypothetical protein
MRYLALTSGDDLHIVMKVEITSTSIVPHEVPDTSVPPARDVVEGKS